MSTYFEGAVKQGTTPSESQNVGYAVFSQSVLIDHVVEVAAGNNNVDSTVVLPAGSQIIEVVTDTLTAWNSVTSAGLTVGSTAGGTEYASSVDVKSAGRGAPTLTGAQLAAMDDIGSNTTVHVRVAQAGNTSAGQARVTILYVPRA